MSSETKQESPPLTKHCRGCGKEKPLASFGKRTYLTAKGKKKSTTRAYCSECATKRTYEWRKKNPEKYNKYQRKYQKKLKKIYDEKNK